MKILKYLLVLVTVVAVLIGALLATLSVVDVDQYKGQIEKQVSQVLGRDFAIEGDSELSVSTLPGVQLRGVRIQNADWGSRADMVYAAEVEVVLAVLPLLSGHVNVKKVVLLEPDVLLETNQEGQGNWEFPGLAAEPEAAPKPETGDPGEPISVSLEQVTLKNGRFQFIDGVSQKRYDLVLDNVSLAAADDDKLEWKLDAALNEVALQLTGKSDTVKTLLGGRPWEGHFEGRVGDIEFSANTSAEDVLNLVGLNLETRVEAKDLSSVGKMLAQELPALGPVEVTGKVTSADALYKVDVSGALADLKMALAGSLAESLDGKGADLNLSLETPGTKRLTDLFGMELPELGAVNVTGKLTEAEAFFKLLLDAQAGEIKLGVDGQVAQDLQLKNASGEVTVNAPDLKVFSHLAGTELPSMAPVAIKTTLKDLGERFDVLLTGNVGKVKLSADTQIAHPLDLEGLSGKFNVQAPSLSEFSALAGTELPNLAPVKLGGTLADAGQVFKLDLKGEAGKLVFGANGQVAESLDGKGVDIDLLLKSPDLKLLGDLAGTELPSVGPVDVKAKLTDVADGHKISGLVAKVGKSDLAGSAEVGHQAKPMRVVAAFDSKLLDLTPFEAPTETSEAKPEKAAKAPKEAGEKKPEKVFSPDPLPFDQLKQLDADVKVKVAALQTPARDFSDVELVVRAKDGRLEVAPLKASTAGGSLRGDAVVDASKKVPTVQLNFDADKIELGKVKYLQDFITGASANATIKLNGAGVSMQQIMAGLNGQAIVDVGSGEMSVKLLDVIGADVLVQLVSALNPTKKPRPTAPLNCAALRFDIKDGIANTDKGIALETDKTHLIGNGKIDLKTEKIALQIRAEAASGTGVGAGDLTKAIGVGGTLASPSATLDAAGLATTGATVGAAVATGGLSYLAQKAVEKVAKDPAPCKTALAGKPPKQAKASSEEVTE